MLTGVLPMDVVESTHRTTSHQSAGSDGQLIPDEQHVTELLTAHDGVAWQRHVKEATGWSASKTSRVLSSMEDEDAVTRYQIGRQKVVCLPDEEPELLGSAGDGHPPSGMP